MLDQKIVEQAYNEFMNGPCKEYTNPDYISFVEGFRWAETYLQSQQKEDVLAKLVPKRISCGGY